MRQELYEMIFKRKSFHLFRNVGKERLSAADVEQIREVYSTLAPLYPEIRTAVRIVPARETTCRAGAEYCILLYSEKKDNYLQNIGYLGEQLDLYLVSQNIGTLWYGMGKTKEAEWDGLEYVIMISIAKVDDGKKFRKDLFKARRKPLEETWLGRPIVGVTDIARFAPSACNSQPWLVEREGGTLTVYRYRKPGKVGLIPARQVPFYGRIDIGIYQCFLDLCLAHEGIAYDVERFTDHGTDEEKTPAAVYRMR